MKPSRSPGDNSRIFHSGLGEDSSFSFPVFVGLNGKMKELQIVVIVQRFMYNFLQEICSLDRSNRNATSTGQTP